MFVSIIQEGTAVAALGVKQVSSPEKYKSLISVKRIKPYILRRNGLHHP